MAVLLIGVTLPAVGALPKVTKPLDDTYIVVYTLPANGNAGMVTVAGVSSLMLSASSQSCVPPVIAVYVPALWANVYVATFWEARPRPQHKAIMAANSLEWSNIDPSLRGVGNVRIDGFFSCGSRNLAELGFDCQAHLHDETILS